MCFTEGLKGGILRPVPKKVIFLWLIEMHMYPENN